MKWKRNVRTGILRPVNTRLFRNQFGGKSRSERRRLLLEEGGSGYDYTLTVGNYSDSHYGKYAGLAGDIDPADFEGGTVNLCSSHSTVFQLSFTGTTQPGSYATITIDLEGYGEFDCIWNGSQFNSSGSPAGLHAYLIAQVGNDLGLTFTGA